MKPETVEEQLEAHASVILREVRRILEVPEGASIIDHAKKIMEERK